MFRSPSHLFAAYAGVVLLALPTLVAAEGPDLLPEKTVREELELFVERTDEAAVLCGNLPAVRIGLRNRSSARTRPAP